MRVKRYVVDSMPDAMHKIRTDLGKDAVILNTKQIRMGGFLGMFSKKKIEVIAATDASSEAPSAASSRPAAMPTPRAAEAASPTLSFAGAYAAAAARQGAAANASRGSEAPVAAAQEAVERGTFRSVAVSDAPPPASNGAAARPREPLTAPPRAAEDTLLEEIKQMKEMMSRISRSAAVSEPEEPVVTAWRQRLLAQEIAPELAERLLTRVRQEAEEAGEAISDELAARSLRSQLAELVPGGKALSAETRIAQFVGPTGVGKTTTIAKLAAEQVLKHRRKVGLITADTYRVAAVEQLRTYATILNVPLEVVVSPLDLNKAFESLKDRDIILMDTAGRNFRNEMHVSETNALLRDRGASETYLVLSLTTKYSDMRAIARNFSQYKLDKVLFTKMDETDSYGPILNLLEEFPLQLSYLTNGQSVPDDIAEADGRRIIDAILGERSYA